MAGRGPAPGSGAKPPEQRRRRNPPAAFEELPAEGFKGSIPPLGAGYRVELEPVNDEEEDAVVVPYCQQTREWYEAWARSPMATKFCATDWNRLRWVIAPLFDRYVAHPRRDLAAELRLQEERLGATVMDRSRLRQAIGEPARRAQTQRARTANRRASLRALPSPAATKRNEE